MAASSPNRATSERVFFTTRLHWVVFVRSLILALIAWGLQHYSVHDVLLDQGFPVAALWWDDASLVSIRLVGMDLETLLSPLAAMLGAVTLLTAFLRVRSTRLQVTSTRVVARHGILWSREDVVPYQCVDGVSVSRGVLGRLLGYGTVRIAGPGVVATWRSVERPDALRRAAEARLTAWLCHDLGGSTVRPRVA